MGNKKKPLGHGLPLHLAGAAIKKFETEPATDMSRIVQRAERSAQAALTRNAAAEFGLLCYADGARRWGFAGAVPNRSGCRGRTAHVNDRQISARLRLPGGRRDHDRPGNERAQNRRLRGHRLLRRADARAL